MYVGNTLHTYIGTVYVGTFFECFVEKINYYLYVHRVTEYVQTYIPNCPILFALQFGFTIY
jgi:hypothetical protein